MTARQIVEEESEESPKEFLRRRRAKGKDVPLHQLRRLAAIHVIQRVELNHSFMPKPRLGRDPDAWIRLHAVTAGFVPGRGYTTTRVYQTGFASFSVAAQALRQWYNLRGAPLFIDDEDCGKIDYMNPDLKLAASWPNA